MSVRAVHVVPTITNEASGPSYSVVKLCQELLNADCDVTLAVLDAVTGSPCSSFTRLFPAASFPARLGRSPEMRRWLRDTVVGGRVDIVHNHSIWMMPNVYAGWAVRGEETPLVVSPRGTLSSRALNHSKWVKRVFWYALQRKVLRQVSCFHATAESEYQEIRKAGFQQPVCIIPNGIDIPEKVLISDRIQKYRRLLFLGRIHPQKGVDLLLHAWGVISPSFQDWELEIVGPDNIGYLQEMKVLASTLRLKNIVFRGALYGEEKWRAYQEADIYVLPTHSENFGMTIAEAMASGTPVITTHGAPWAGLEKHGAGWWIETGLDPLVACLEQAMTTSSTQLTSMGNSGREWMRQDFSWYEIAHKMKLTYQWLHGGGDRPAWVRQN